MIRKKILIIEDSELISSMITDILKTEDYETVTAKSGEEGLIKVYKEKPDLILLDVVLPGIDGFEVCRILRVNKDFNRIPIIILTSQINEGDKLKGLELGADDYIVKPFNPRELKSRVKNIILRIDRNRDVSPLTGLPGNLEIQTEISRRLELFKVFSMIYADLDNFKAFNDAYGFARGDIAIKLTADIVYDNVRNKGIEEDFIGHIGGDDFIILTEPIRVDSICEGIIKDFDLKIRDLYDKNDLENNYITTIDRRGNITTHPIMTISMAVVSNEYREFKSYEEMAQVAAEVKRFAKLAHESNYFKDRRRTL